MWQRSVEITVWFKPVESTLAVWYHDFVAGQGAIVNLDIIMFCTVRIREAIVFFNLSAFWHPSSFSCTSVSLLPSTCNPPLRQYGSVLEAPLVFLYFLAGSLNDYKLTSITGLLRLTSSPVGLVYDSNFVSGTREEVTATYRATCCAPRMLVNAVDSFGNTNSYIVDISSKFMIIFKVIILALSPDCFRASA